MGRYFSYQPACHTSQVLEFQPQQQHKKLGMRECAYIPPSIEKVEAGGCLGHGEQSAYSK